MIKFFEDHVDTASPTRAKLSVHMRSHRLAAVTIEPVVDLIKARNVEVATELTEFVQSKPKVDQLRSFVEKYLAEKQVSEADSKDILAKVDSLGEFVAPQGAEVVYWAQDIRAAGVPGPHAQPGECSLISGEVADPGRSSLMRDFVRQSFPWTRLFCRISRVRDNVEEV
jgi:hypothetical protein